MSIGVEDDVAVVGVVVVVSVAAVNASRDSAASSPQTSCKVKLVVERFEIGVTVV